MNEWLEADRVTSRLSKSTVVFELDVGTNEGVDGLQRVTAGGASILSD